MKLILITLLFPILCNAQKENEHFLYCLRVAESGNNYEAVNQFGYYGAYQFGNSRLSDFGLSTVDIEGSKEKQDIIAKVHFHDIEKRLKLEIALFAGANVRGIYVTKSGLLAAAHLLGVRGLNLWLYHGILKKDGNGKTVLFYLKKFSNFDVKF